ncbi:class I SAM-dependent methyltransferase [Streptomyces sp. LP05-1]|uniref:Class I SAM-dependent methyltransferase n=1 Tax=Streptomyces pyxinae TaxID=2970734 RepID=A0ABT2CGK9_9ACTN|nr:class I SAM-dependent methyltransferase [Streptomyces sp. LP05-1]MCS0636531.1 class I SAM-dependent methyltransferase [Streptomyces sp. LP05-1]
MTTDAPNPANSSSYDADYWDERYAGRDRVWSGRPNATLVAEITGLTPGHALDLGCGEGGDALWLARQGWRVTAADISGVALERGARQAAEEGLADLIEWQRHDLAVSFPEGRYDLVTSGFLHSPGEGMPRERILRDAVAAVAPGGTLLVMGHAGPPPWDPDGYPGVSLPMADEVLAGLSLPPGEWEVVRCEEYERSQTAPDGRECTRLDNVVRVRRRPAE